MVLSTRIINAARHGRTEAVQDWFTQGGNPNDTQLNTSRNLLHYAARGGHCGTMRMLLDRGADPNAVCRDGSTPLHEAASSRNCDAVSLLLRRGAALDARNNGGRSAETYARDRKWRNVRALLAAVRRAGTPLIRAAIIGDCDMIGLLLSRGATLDARDNNGHNAEGWARKKNQQEAVDLLAAVRLAGGWNPFSLDQRKRLLALRVLCEQGRAKTEDALLRRLFPWHPPTIGVMTRAARRARTQGAVLPNKFVFWLILKFWRD